MSEKINVGIIGLGKRGSMLMETVILPQPNVAVTAVCDVYQDRVEAAAAVIAEHSGQRPFTTTDYSELIKHGCLDAVVVATAWENHIETAVMAMEAGVYVGLEVGGAYSTDELWHLVRTYERTKTPVMLMENCCYGRNELLVQNMVEKGVFGKIVHCAGGYHHDLREEITHGVEDRHYRLRNYINRNCENYPTHELGPIARILDINRGNQMLTLTSMASSAHGLHEYLKRHKSDDAALLNTQFRQGDIINTMIKCAHGETIVLTLDTSLPRFYSRGLQVRGTKGMFFEDNQSVFLDQEHAAMEMNWTGHNIEEYREKHEHPIWKRYIEEGVKEGHDGMDWLVFSDFFQAVEQGTQTPIDVYDTAAWMVISTLSEQSIALGGQPVPIPDFTQGKWIMQPRINGQ